MAAVQHQQRPNYANNNPLAQAPPQQPPSAYRPPTAPASTASSSSTAVYSTYSSTSIALPTVLDRPLPLQPRQQREVALSSFAWLFSELIQYCQQRADSVSDIEKKLSELGYGVGIRYLDLSLLRSSPTLHPSTLSRPRTLLTLLQHIHGSVWKQLFSHAADGLEKSTDSNDEYYIYDNLPVTNRFLSVPKGLGSLNCASFVAGIVAGVCDAAGFTCEVTAHFNAPSGTSKERTVYIIKFDDAVMKREATMQA